MTDFDPNLQPQSEITLNRAVEGDKTMWVYENHDEIVEMLNAAKRDGWAMITLNRVLGIGNPGKSFSTQPGNIVNVRDISEA